MNSQGAPVRESGYTADWDGRGRERIARSRHQFWTLGLRLGTTSRRGRDSTRPRARSAVRTHRRKRACSSPPGGAGPQQACGCWRSSRRRTGRARACLAPNAHARSGHARSVRGRLPLALRRGDCCTAGAALIGRGCIVAASALGPARDSSSGRPHASDGHRLAAMASGPQRPSAYLGRADHQLDPGRGPRHHRRQGPGHHATLPETRARTVRHRAARRRRPAHGAGAGERRRDDSAARVPPKARSTSGRHVARRKRALVGHCGRSMVVTEARRPLRLRISQWAGTRWW